MNCPFLSVDQVNLELDTTILPQAVDAQYLARVIEHEATASLLHPVVQQTMASGRPLVAIDRGCGTGRNSSVLLGAFARAVRTQCQAPIITIFNERFPSQLSGLAETQVAVPVVAAEYRAMVCGSFLDQLLPSNSVLLVTSNAALHWLDLSRDGGGQGGEAWAMLAAQQWQRFLRNATAELQPGGRLVVSLVAASPLGHEHVPLRLLRRAIWEIVGELIEADEIERAVPIYLRSQRELVSPFESTEELLLHYCRIEEQRCPYYAAFLQHGDVARYAHELTGFIRGFSLSALTRWVADRFGEEAVNRYVHEIFGVVQAWIASDPDGCQMRKHRAVLVAEKR